MNDVHTSIGALEIGAAAVLFGDATLEQAGQVAMSPPPTHPLSLSCRHVDDGALEQTATVTMGPPTRATTPTAPNCR